MASLIHIYPFPFNLRNSWERKKLTKEWAVLYVSYSSIHCLLSSQEMLCYGTLGLNEKSFKSNRYTKTSIFPDCLSLIKQTKMNNRYEPFYYPTLQIGLAWTYKTTCTGSPVTSSGELSQTLCQIVQRFHKELVHLPNAQQKDTGMPNQTTGPTDHWPFQPWGWSSNCDHSKLCITHKGALYLDPGLQLPLIYEHGPRLLKVQHHFLCAGISPSLNKWPLEIKD